MIIRHPVFSIFLRSHFLINHALLPDTVCVKIVFFDSETCRVDADASAGQLPTVVYSKFNEFAFNEFHV